MISNWTVKNPRCRYAASYPSSVDLQKLCDSYRDKGEMGLPRELIDEIMRYNDLQTLKGCSLTSGAFYSAARPLIHRRIALGARSALRGSHTDDDIHSDDHLNQADVFHAHYLSEAEERGLLRPGYVREVHLDLGIGNPEKVLQLRQLLALDTVHTLTINSLALDQILPIFDRCFSQFVRTLRSLSLETARCKDAHQLIEFACRFPHLDDLELINPCGLEYGMGLPDAPQGSEGPQPEQPLPLGGHLVLRGGAPLVQCLLDLPGGVRFRSIEAISNQKDLAKLLAACSSTLEVLNIGCFESRKSNNLTRASVH